MSIPTWRVDAGGLLLGQVEAVQQRLPAGAADHHSHEPDPRVERGPDGSALVAAVAGHDHRGGTGRVGAVGRPLDDEAEPGRERRERLVVGEAPTRCSTGAGSMRLEVDLQGATGQARVDHDAGAGRLGEDVVAVGQHPQQHGLPRPEGPQRGGADRAGGAVPADEALDGPVGQHDRPVAGVGRGRLLGAHHRGLDERHPRRGELARSGSRSWWWSHPHPVSAPVRSAGSRDPASRPRPGTGSAACPRAGSRTA